MKKIFRVVLVSILLVTLYRCGYQEGAKTPDDSSVDIQTIQVYYVSGPPNIN